ncbi:MAG: ComF family protein [Candidatus Nealsonbacteria bacterium]|nr:ComF family protein [Candidatus Nealsonbacteria bacterium]
MWIKIKNLILDIFFPKFCFNCEKEGNYLCQDCQELLEISGFHRNYSTQNLDDLYFAVDYKNPLIKKLIQRFKYEPFVKKLAKSLSYLIITHFQLMDNKPNFLPQPEPQRRVEKNEHVLREALDPRTSNGADFILIPVPLDKKRLRWRGFNQAEELSKELAKFLKIPSIPNSLTKIKETFPQIKLSDKERKENVRGVFLIKDRELIKNKNILLVDDVYTTGATMEECAIVLKKAGAKDIIGVVVARG